METWNNFFDGWTVLKTCKIQSRFIEKILEYTNRESKILEIGAGSGITSLILYYSDRIFTSASEKDDVMISVLLKTLSECEMEIVKCDMFDMQMDKKFDCIFHQGVLEHFSDEDIVRTLKEQAKYSKYIIFDIPNARRLKRVQEYGNERFMYVRKWKKLIKESGLELVEYDGRRLSKIFKHLPFDLQNNKYINKYFGTSSIFVCKSKNI